MDRVRFRLAAQGEVRAVEIDTARLGGNAAGWTARSGRDGESGEWCELLPPTPARTADPAPPPARAPAVVTHVRLDAFPDGGSPGCGCTAPSPSAARSNRGAATAAAR
ncbi:hypothetical protein [Streptomyces wuyuanensis]|uniref:hypothetical protein n=1 Tax=Streptomyces wuyuanensis TaxID=1196353 RepID=UPI0037F3181E